MPLEYRSPGPTMSALFSDELWLNVFFAAEWAVRLTMIVVVPFRRSPEAAKGWLLLIFFEPTVWLDPLRFDRPSDAALMAHAAPPRVR